MGGERGCIDTQTLQGIITQACVGTGLGRNPHIPLMYSHMPQHKLSSLSAKLLSVQAETVGNYSD